MAGYWYSSMKHLRDEMCIEQLKICYEAVDVVCAVKVLEEREVSANGITWDLIDVANMEREFDKHTIEIPHKTKSLSYLLARCRHGSPGIEWNEWYSTRNLLLFAWKVELDNWLPTDASIHDTQFFTFCKRLKIDQLDATKASFDTTQFREKRVSVLDLLKFDRFVNRYALVQHEISDPIIDTQCRHLFKTLFHLLEVQKGESTTDKLQTLEPCMKAAYRMLLEQCGTPVNEFQLMVPYIQNKNDTVVLYLLQYLHGVFCGREFTNAEVVELRASIDKELREYSARLRENFAQ